MQSKEEFETHIRLCALEYLLQDAMKLIYFQLGLNPEQMQQRHANIRRGLSAETIPGADAILADAALGELQERVGKTLAGIEEMMEESWRKSRLQGRS